MGISFKNRINFMLSKDNGESQPIHSKSDNIENMIGTIIDYFIRNY